MVCGPDGMNTASNYRDAPPLHLLLALTRARPSGVLATRDGLWLAYLSRRYCEMTCVTHVHVRELVYRVRI